MPIDSVMASLRHDTHADAAVFLRFGQHRGEVVLSDVRVDGESLHWPLMCDGTAPVGFDHDCSDDALSMREGQWCLQAPAERHFNRFCWLDEDIAQRAPWSRSDANRLLYEPNGFTEQYRAVLVERGEVTGWVALLWKQPPRQRTLIASATAKHLEDMQSIARNLHKQPRTSHRFLLDDRGESLAHNAELLTVFDHHALREIRHRCQPTQHMGESVSFFNGYALCTVPMNAEVGLPATLVLVEPLEPVIVDMRKALTSLQRRVAELVAEGRSNSQAAQILDISVNTVKYHLGNIYPILGVTNRVELAWFLSARH